MNELKERILGFFDHKIKNSFNSHFNFYITITILGAFISGLITYLLLSLNSKYLSHNSLTGILVIDLIFVLILMVMITRKIFTIIYSEKSSSGKNSLLIKIVYIFTVITAIPTIIMAIFSTIFFNFGIQTWFNDKVSTALEESLIVAESYFKEHKNHITSDVISLANDIEVFAGNTNYNKEVMGIFLDKQIEDRSLNNAILFRNDPYMVVAKSKFALDFSIYNLPNEAIEQANQYNIVFLDDLVSNNAERINGHASKVKALVKLRSLNLYLLIDRFIDEKVTEHMAKTQDTVSEYEQLKSRIGKIQIQFLLTFIIVSLLLLLTAIAVGIVFASRIVRPINMLLNVTEELRSGNLSARVEYQDSNKDEISALSSTFNAMAKTIQTHNDALIKANQQIDYRRHFSETIIEGVSTGIIVMDHKGLVRLINSSAKSLLDIKKDVSKKSDLNLVFPEFSLFFNIKDLENFNIPIAHEVTITRKRQSYILLVKVIAEIFDNKVSRFILTMDNISPLIQAQRNAAWSDVARRIAHEIKNPLTPVQLAAERLKKKYIEQVADKEGFLRYIATIIRNVNDIGKMVETFVSFAKMPVPKFTPTDLVSLLKDFVDSKQALINSVTYIFESESKEVQVNADQSQIQQVLTNLYKNAEEAPINKNQQLTIQTKLSVKNHCAIITIEDNGHGFDEKIFAKLAEPYTTNKQGGTGLGLSIVTKIIQDHHGKIKFLNGDGGGALVTIEIPLL